MNRGTYQDQDPRTATSILLSGVVLDMLTNQPVQGVHVFTAPGIGTTTDALGAYALAVGPNETVGFSHVSYQPMEWNASEVPTTLHLIPATYEIPEVEIFPDDTDAPTEGGGNAWRYGLGALFLGWLFTRKRRPIHQAMVVALLLGLALGCVLGHLITVYAEQDPHDREEGN